MALTFVLPLVVFFIWMVHGVIIPVALGALLAVILYPLMPPLQQRLGRSKALAPGLIILLSVGLVLLPTAFVVSMSLRTLQHGSKAQLTEFRHSIEQAVSSQLDRASTLAQRVGVPIDPAVLRERVIDGIEVAVEATGGSLGQAAMSIPEAVVSLLLLMVSLWTFLRDGPVFVGWLAARMPFATQQTQDLFESVRHAIRGVVLGSMLTGLLQSALTLAALLICGVPGAFVWSVLAFVLSFLPMLGTTPITLGAALYLALSAHLPMAAGMLVAALLIGTADNLVRPLVQGSESNMPSLLTLMAIFGGLQAMGAAGIFLGPVVAAMAMQCTVAQIPAR